MLLRWSLVYILSVMTLVLGCLVVGQRAYISAGVASRVALEEQFNTQRQEAEREAKAVADRLTEERHTREAAERAFARAENQIAQSKKLLDAADKRVNRTRAELEDERRVRSELEAAIAAGKEAVSMVGECRSETAEAGSARTAETATDVTATLTPPESDARTSLPEISPTVAASEYPLPLRKPAPEVVGSLLTSQEADPALALKPASEIVSAPASAKPRAANKSGSARQAKTKSRKSPSKSADADFFPF